MNARLKLNEVKRLLDKAQQLTETLIEAQPKPIPGQPKEPHRHSQRIEWAIWNLWHKLKALPQFTAARVKRMAIENVERDRHYLQYCSDSSFSSILSRWAKEGSLEIVEQGRGRRPSIFKIPN
ncbi:MAG: hypothetical protein ABSE16_20170 [Verrucomicrobiota bacterium]|jgi:hypothetical protein